MSEHQAMRAMEILAKLYAEQMGFKNPVITVTKKERSEKKCSKTQ